MLIKTTFLVLILYFNVDVGNCGCKDDESLRFQVKDEKLTCAEYIPQYPCDCRKTFTNNLNEEVTVKKACCASCKGKNLKECDCQDLLSKETTFQDFTFNSCEDLVNDVPELCLLDGVGQKKGMCCKSCKDASLDCIDTKVKKWQIDDEEYDCPAFIAIDKCLCVDHGEDCCESCKDQDLSDCCLNDPKFKLSAKVKKGKKCKKCNCEDLIVADPTGVLMDSVCVKNSRNARKRCCKSCKAVNSKFTLHG